MAQMSFRISEESKNDFESICDELGMTPTTALTIFIKKMCREKRIPFDVSLYSPETMRIIEETRLNKNLSKSFSTVEEVFEDLNAED